MCASVRQRIGLIVVIAASGCGGTGTYPVEGVVVFKDGKPLTGGLVMFELTGDGPAKVCARGDIQSDGTFRLSTTKPNDGAAPGLYRAWITPPLPSGGEGSLRTTPIHPKFVDPRTSGLEFSVERRKNHFKIEIDRP